MDTPHGGLDEITGYVWLSKHPPKYGTTIYRDMQCDFEFDFRSMAMKERDKSEQNLPNHLGRMRRMHNTCRRQAAVEKDLQKPLNSSSDWSR